MGGLSVYNDVVRTRKEEIKETRGRTLESCFDAAVYSSVLKTIDCMFMGCIARVT